VKLLYHREERQEKLEKGVQKDKEREKRRERGKTNGVEMIKKLKASPHRLVYCLMFCTDFGENVLNMKLFG